jgi:predicted esterase
LQVFSTDLKYPIDPTEVSVSGLSAGGFMAVQYHVAFSASVKGVAVFAGGPYYCAEGSLSNAFTHCMYGIMMDVNKLISSTKTFDSHKSIDQVGNLTKSRVYMFSGTSDTTVYPAVMKGLDTYYKAFVDGSGIKPEFSIRSEHCLPTLDFGNAYF